MGKRKGKGKKSILFSRIKKQSEDLLNRFRDFIEGKTTVEEFVSKEPRQNIAKVFDMMLSKTAFIVSDSRTGLLSYRPRYKKKILIPYRKKAYEEEAVSDIYGKIYSLYEYVCKLYEYDTDAIIKTEMANAIKSGEKGLGKYMRDMKNITHEYKPVPFKIIYNRNG